MGWNTELSKSPQTESEFAKGYLSEYDRGYQDGCKETAERDFNTIIKALEERKDKVKIVYGIAEKAGVDMAISEVKKLAERFGVKTEE